MLKKVYISSTYKDLIVYRNAIRDMFLSKGLQNEYTLVGMEGYVSESGKRPIDVCIADVNKSDIYILILAKRYGSVVEETGISYTETEYRAAMKKMAENPLFKVFVFYSSTEMEKEDFEKMGKENAVTLQDLENPNLEEFYREVLQNNAGFIESFTSPDNLCMQILLTFGNSFKRPSSVSDYNGALMLLDRKIQSYNFSKSFKHRSNFFYFSAEDLNAPVDFLDRLYNFEMSGQYEKRITDLTSFLTTDEEKFRDNFIAELQLEDYWDSEKKLYSFKTQDRLFISIKISSIQITVKDKLDYLQKILKEFLPVYLFDEGFKTATNRVLFIFYSSNSAADTANKFFKNFIDSLTNSISQPGVFCDINSLNDITKADTKKWMEAFVSNFTFDENTIDEILEVSSSDPPPETFKMKKANSAIKKWLQKTFFTN
jgi:hypothetical protein